MTFDELIRRFLAWSEQQRDLRAAIIIGSRARASPPPDEWSDLDLVLVTTHPDRYLSESAWLHELRAPWLTFLEPTATRTHTERRVLFEGEIDVDVIPVSPSDLERLATGTRLDDADAIHRGFRVLLDKDGLTGTIERSAGLHQPAPPAAAFEALVHDFLYHAVSMLVHDQSASSH